MPVPPIEGVGSEIGRHHTILVEHRDLIFAQCLGMDHDCSPIGIAECSPHRFNAANELIASGVAIDVREHRHAGREVGVQIPLERFIGKMTIAAIVFAPTFRRHMVGLCQPCGLALRRAVEHELDAANAKSILIAP